MPNFKITLEVDLTNSNTHTTANSNLRLAYVKELHFYPGLI